MLDHPFLDKYLPKENRLDGAKKVMGHLIEVVSEERQRLKELKKQHDEAIAKQKAKLELRQRQEATRWNEENAAFFELDEDQYPSTDESATSSNNSLNNIIAQATTSTATNHGASASKRFGEYIPLEEQFSFNRLVRRIKGEEGNRGKIFLFFLVVFCAQEKKNKTEFLSKAKQKRQKTNEE